MKLVSAVVMGLVLFSAPAFAAKKVLSIPMGELRNVSIPGGATHVEVSDPAVLDTHKRANGVVVLSPKQPGRAVVKLETDDQTEVELLVFVTSGGGVELVTAR